MVEYTTIFFWFGGVLAEPFDRLTASVLVPGAQGTEKVSTWQALRVHAENLALGKINPAEYCALAAEVTGSSLTSDELEQRLLEAIALRPQVISIINSIPETYDCRLIADIPESWLSQVTEAHADVLPFAPEKVDFLTDLSLAKIHPDILAALQERLNLHLEDCLMVDGNSNRAIDTVKRGLSSIIYVTPSRLKHELALQGILQAGNEVLHPQSSERVEL